MDTTIEYRVKAFSKLGKILGLAAEYINGRNEEFEEKYPEFTRSVELAGQYNRWFTAENISFALGAWSETLTPAKISHWISRYPGAPVHTPKTIAVIMAGNVPLVGCHDFICTLMSGHKFLGKLSADDAILLPAAAKLLCELEPRLIPFIQFTNARISGFDAVIATGSNNTARYFEYYFKEYQHIIRRNRNGVAVLIGNETTEILQLLGSDICSYFGLGCRNVSKVLVPEGYDVTRLFEAVAPFETRLEQHSKYMNNYSYQKSILLLNQTPHFDNGTVILKLSNSYSSSISVLHYEEYVNLENIKAILKNDAEQIQCVVTNAEGFENSIKPGQSQQPQLWDYADGVDIMDFLLKI